MDTLMTSYALNSDAIEVHAEEAKDEVQNVASKLPKWTMAVICFDAAMASMTSTVSKSTLSAVDLDEGMQGIATTLGYVADVYLLSFVGLFLFATFLAQKFQVENSTRKNVVGLVTLVSWLSFLFACGLFMSLSSHSGLSQMCTR